MFDNFVLVDKEERNKRLGILVSKVKHVSCHNDDVPFFEAALFDHIDAPLGLLIFNQKEFPFIDGEHCTVSFVIRSVRFCCQGVAETFGDYHAIRLSDELFKYEKREEERLLTYPHYKVFIELDGRLLHQAKTLFLNRVSKEHEKLLATYEKKFQQSGDKKKGSIVEVRVMNLSKSGCALLVPEMHSTLFDKEYRSKVLSEFLLYFNGATYLLHKGKVVHAVDYLDSNNLRGRWYKMGISFKEDSNLTAHLKGYFESIEAHSEKKIADQFSQFIKNERANH